MDFFQPINANKLMELVKNHPDYSNLKVNCVEDLKDQINSFLSINKTEFTFREITTNIETNLCASSNHHHAGI